MKKKIASLASVLLLPLLAFSLLLSSCKKDDQTAEENITKVVLHFTGDGFDKEFAWEDADGVGGNDPVVGIVTLPTDKTLSCHIHVYDGDHDLTHEIEDEAASHFWTFLSPLSNFQIQYADKDANDKPLGLETKWTTTTVANGSVKITLYHEPTDKSNLDAPGGEIDFTADFVVKVQ